MFLKLTMFLSMCIDNRPDIKDDINATKNVVLVLKLNVVISCKLANTVIGMDSKNTTLIDSFLFNPNSKADVNDIPERDAPGITAAINCDKPINVMSK